MTDDEIAAIRADNAIRIAAWRNSDHVLTFIGRPDKPVTNNFTVTITKADRDATNREHEEAEKAMRAAS